MILAGGISAVAVSGSPSATSKSRQLLDHAVGALASAGVRTERVDLAALPAAALLGREESPHVAGALSLVRDASIVVASTPVYRAAYSGLLKVFFDLLPRDALAGKIGIPIATGASPEHALVLPHAFVPLYASVGAVCVAGGIYATDAQFAGGVPEPELVARVEGAVAEAIALAHGVGAAFRPAS